MEAKRVRNLVQKKYLNALGKDQKLVMPATQTMIQIGLRLASLRTFSMKSCQTEVILAAMLTSAGVDLEQINMSRSSCHRRLVETSETVGDEGLTDYVEEVKKENLGEEQ